jgi:AcrR family transcriptional regulator
VRAQDTGSPPPRRRGRPREPGVRETIVGATLELIAEGGFPAATIDAIAARSGVGRNTIYRRWASKEDLLADALGELTAELELPDGEEIRPLLLVWISELARLFADPLYGRILPGLLAELQRNPAFAHSYIERIVHPLRHRLVELLSLAQSRGELRADLDVELVADLVGGPAFLRLLPFGHPPVSEHYAGELLATIWDGIGR